MAGDGPVDKPPNLGDRIRARRDMKSPRALGDDVRAYVDEQIAALVAANNLKPPGKKK